MRNRVLTPAILQQWLEEKRPITLFDIRGNEEETLEKVPGSIPILPSAISKTSVPCVLYCDRGAKSQFWAEKIDHPECWSLEGGLVAWKRAGLPMEKLKEGAWERFGVQMRLPEIGELGQKRLAEAKVLIVGAGGLGSPAALYLAAAGIGQIGILDPDLVELGNLQRQLLHRVEDLGKTKVESARRQLHAMVPDLNIEVERATLDESNGDAFFARYGLVIDGTDNYESKFLLNRLSLRHSKPWIFASIAKFEGQMMFFTPHEGPCYRCLYGAVPSFCLDCEEGGVIGPLAGMMGSLQALEAIKWMVGLPNTSALIRFNGLDLCWQQFKVERDENCSDCHQYRNARST